MENGVNGLRLQPRAVYTASKPPVTVDDCQISMAHFDAILPRLVFEL